MTSNGKTPFTQIIVTTLNTLPYSHVGILIAIAIAGRIRKITCFTIPKPGHESKYLTNINLHAPVTSIGIDVYYCIDDDDNNGDNDDNDADNNNDDDDDDNNDNDDNDLFCYTFLLK